MVHLSLALFALALAPAALAQDVSVSTNYPPPSLQGDKNNCPGHHVARWKEGCKSSKCFSYTVGINCIMMYPNNSGPKVTNCKLYQNSDCTGYYQEFKGKVFNSVQVSNIQGAKSMQCWNGC